MSGAATGGILAARAGPKAMASAAVVGGIILALIEGMGIWMNNYFSMPPPGMEGKTAARGAIVLFIVSWHEPVSSCIFLLHIAKYSLP
jgi:hypothetical protein